MLAQVIKRDESEFFTDAQICCVHAMLVRDGVYVRETSKSPTDFFATSIDLDLVAAHPDVVVYALQPMADLIGLILPGRTVPLELRVSSL